MTRIRKSYFTLEELAGGWGLPGADLRYVAENGLLKLSVRVIGIYMEFGIWEEADEGEPPMSIPSGAVRPVSRPVRRRSVPSSYMR